MTNFALTFVMSSFCRVSCASVCVRVCDWRLQTDLSSIRIEHVRVLSREEHSIHIRLNLIFNTLTCDRIDADLSRIFEQVSCGD